MQDTGVRQRAREPLCADRAAFDLVASKLRRPRVRPGTVRRRSLVERLARDVQRPVVSVVAPGGYGKTTLLAQWAERNDQAFGWVSVDEADNDPKVLLTYVAAALDAVEPVGVRVFEALASPVSSVPGSVVPRLGAALSSMSVPVVLVLDDVHLLHDSECRAALSVLADQVPAGSRLALAGRDEPPVRVARLRAEGRIAEIGPGDLSLTRDEASALLRAAELTLSEDEVAVLHERTEGWPAGLYLAALCLREGGSPGDAAVSFRGDDRLVGEYLESEFLARIPARQRAFLTRTAVLERMCGPLCEAVLDMPGSAASLADLARSNLLLVPLDRRGQWYRYHHLFRDLLLAQLERQSLDLIPVLQRRAADWCLRHNLPSEALEYCMAAEDVEAAARLVQQLYGATDRQGRFPTVQRWFRWLDERGAIDKHPALAVSAVFAAMVGRPTERWAAIVDRWQPQEASLADDPATEARAALAEACLCRRGVEQLRADADRAARKLAAANLMVPAAQLMQGLACIMGGDPAGADVFLAEAVSAGEQAGAHETRAFALCEQSLLAMARGDWSRAQTLAGQADTVLAQAGIEDSYAIPMIRAVQARTALHRGDIPAARQALIGAQRLRHLLTYALPHVAVQARLELIRVHLGLADMAGARTLMREIDELLNRRPGLGTVAEEAQALQEQLARQRRSHAPGASALTAAELRLLPLLTTHLSATEIAAERFLSPHTVKAQVKSIYRKLDASSRNQAITRARELGLLEG